MERRPLQHGGLAIVLAVVVSLGASIVSAGHVEAAASLRLSASAIPAGGYVTITGTGFSPNEGAVVTSRVVVGGQAQTVQANSTTDGSGSFSVQLIYPGGTTQGTYTVTARDVSGHAASASIAVLPVANIIAGGAPATVNVIPHHRVWINATGFGASETVVFRADFPLYNGNTTTVQRTRAANGNGNVNGLVIAVPNDARAGTVTLTATGQASKKTGTVKLHVVYRPAISLKPATTRPGTSFTVSGRDFVPGTGVKLAVDITYTDGSPATLGRTVVTDATGHFSASIYLPAAVRVGTYTVSARDNTGGFRTSRRLSVAVKPTISLSPSTLYPGQTVKVTGSNFGNGVAVRVTATIQTSGGARQVVAQTVSHANGAYTTYLHIPSNARAGNVVVTARSANGSARATLHIQQRPAPRPTQPAPTATPQPTATSTPTPSQHHKTPALGFHSVSIWYHWMRPGTQEHIIVQSTINTKQGIWVHVWYPNGQHQAWYENTSGSGRWDKWFTVPYNSSTPSNDRALVTFRLWHGKDNVKDFEHFGIVR
jgi:hypothetical protein